MSVIGDHKLSSWRARRQAPKVPKGSAESAKNLAASRVQQRQLTFTAFRPTNLQNHSKPQRAQTATKKIHPREKVGKGWGCSSPGTASDRHAADTGSSPRCGKGSFSQSQFSGQTLLQWPPPPPTPSTPTPVQPHALTSERTLKIL